MLPWVRPVLWLLFFRVQVANAPPVMSFRRCLPQHGIDMQKRDARALVVDLDNTPKQENGVPSHDAQRECCPRLHSSRWLLLNSSSTEVAFFLSPLSKAIPCRVVAARW